MSELHFTEPSAEMPPLKKWRRIPEGKRNVRCMREEYDKEGKLVQCSSPTSDYELGPEGTAYCAKCYSRYAEHGQPEYNGKWSK